MAYVAHWHDLLEIDGKQIADATAQGHSVQAFLRASYKL